MNGWRALGDILNEEAEALRSGRISDLAGLAERKSAAALGLEADVPDAVRARVLAQAERNMALLTAAGRGLKTALQQLREMRSDPGLRTYDESGRTRDHARGGGRFEHKA